MNEDRASKFGQIPESGPRNRNAANFALVFRGRALKLNLPEIILGRAPDAHIPIRSALASRHHARIVATASGPMLEDLQSRNGTFVNSVALQQPTLLCAGDTVSIADETMEVISLVSHASDSNKATLAQMPRVVPKEVATPHPPESGLVSGATAHQRSDFTDDDASLATRAADVFELIGSVADKMLSLGRQDEAQRLLSSHLKNALREARAGAQLSDDLCQKASTYALKLADATENPEWINFAIELYSARRMPLPLHAVERMYTLIRRIKGINITTLRSYVTLLTSQIHTFKPADRFVLQRLEGLQQLAQLG